MTSTAAALPPESPPRSVLCGWSMEATRPTEREVDILAEVLPPGSRIYLSAVPRQTLAEQRACAEVLARRGLVPVPHVAARRLGGEAEAAEHLRACVEEAGVRRLLVIGGDVEHSAGPFESAEALLERLDFAAAGVEEVGVAAYPDGHPRLPRPVLDAALEAKLRAIRAAGLAAHVVTQFCFSPEPLIDWLARLRRAGEDVPVRVGIAGPADVMTLARYAIRCGLVAGPVRGTVAKLEAAARMVRSGAPEPLVDELDQAGAALGAVSAHFFAFGGIERTARWARGLADRRCL